MIAIAFAHAGSVAKEEVYNVTSYPFEVDLSHVKKPIRFQHHISDGDMRVFGWDRDAIEIRIESIDKNYDPEDGSAYLRVNTVTGEVRIESKGDMGDSDVQIGLPRDTITSFGSGDGNILVENLCGDVDCVTSDGEVTLLNVKGRISAETEDGDILLKQESKTEFPVSLSSNDGSIRLELAKTAEAKVYATVFDGDFTYKLSGYSRILPMKSERPKGKKSWRDTLAEGQRSIQIGKSDDAPTILLSTLDGDIFISNQ